MTHGAASTDYAAASVSPKTFSECELFTHPNTLTKGPYLNIPDFPLVCNFLNHKMAVFTQTTPQKSSLVSLLIILEEDVLCECVLMN